MNNIEFEKILSSILGNGEVVDVTDQSIGEALDHYGSRINTMIFLPSGNGHFILDEESTEIIEGDRE